MTNDYPNMQKAIAGKFLLMESLTRHRSRKAYKKIKNWKASIHSEQSNEHYLMQFEELVRHSFFNTVPNTFVIFEEGYLESPLHN